MVLVITMYYIQENEDGLEKYKVRIKQQPLQHLIKLIIQNCGEVFRVEEETSIIPIENGVTIKNVKAEFLTKVEYIDGPSEKVYKVNYEEIKEPNIVLLLKRIWNQEEEALYELIEYVSIKTKVQEKNNEISEILYKEQKVIEQMLQDQSLLDEKIKEMEDLQKELAVAYEHEKLNKERKPVEMYYAAIFSCINFKLVEKIEKQKIEEVCQFYEDINSSKRIRKIGKISK